MGIIKIIVADAVYANTLDAPPEERASLADEWADMRAALASEWLGTRYPQAEVYTDVAVYKGQETGRQLELFAYHEDGKLDEALSASLRTELLAHLEREMAAGDAGQA